MTTYDKSVLVRYGEQYLPTSRCRKYRFREATKETTVSIRSVTSDEAPVAFILHDWSHNNDIHEMPEIRRYKENLYAPVTEANLFCGGKREMVSPDRKEFHLQGHYDDLNYSFEENVSAIIEDAERYLVIDSLLWKKCGEPRYCIYTFGLGHNHGGTALMVDTHYNGNISHTRYFNALHGKEAVEETDRIAKTRGDSKYVGISEPWIEVLDPSAVKCNPTSEHGDGDPFLNSLETMTEKTDSIDHAAILTLVALGHEIGSRMHQRPDWTQLVKE